MMLQKIFKKRSFRRPQKGLDFRTSSNRDTGDSDSFDDTSSAGTASQVTTPNGSGPPLAKPEGSPTSETGSLKRVTFNDPLSSSPVKSLSPENKKTDVNTDLFDGNVLEAFQTGNISIADFLKSPLQSPDLDMVKKNRSFSDFGLPTTEIPRATAAPRKQSLLDRAHSMNSKATRKPPPALPTKPGDAVRERNDENAGKSSVVDTTTPITYRQTQPRENGFHNSMENGYHGNPRGENGYHNGVDHGELAPAVNRDHKPRFSSSLETLAQEVFGDEFQDYLVGATKSPVKISLAKAMSEVSADCGKESEDTSRLKKPTVQPMKKMESLHVDVSPAGRGGRPLTSSHSFNAREHDNRKQLKKDLLTSKSLDITTMNVIGQKLEPNLESWNNNTDLSGSFSPANSVDDPEYTIRMKPIMEDKVATSESAECLSVSSPKNRKKTSDCSLGKNNNIVPITNNQFEFVYRRKLNRLSTSDSQYVNVGSFNDGYGEQDINLSQSSVIDINFPPPPPVDEDEFHEVAIEGYEAQPFSMPSYESEKRSAVYNVSFEHESRFASPDYRLEFANDVDPLIESLMSIVPLPEGRDELVPALSKALGEVVSEIIASRRKLKRMMKAIEIHQQVLKDQNRQIQKQNKEIAELRKTAYALNNLQSAPRDSASFVSSRRTSTDGTNRQSREMVELNLTLDKLLYQCSALQKTPRDDSFEHLDTDENGRLAFPGSPNIRRVKSCPSRKLKYTKKSVVEDETGLN